MTVKKITVERLKEVLRYNPDTGCFIWLITLSPRALAGAKAGYLNKRTGYNTIRIDGVLYQAHRLAWLYMTGIWPLNEIDHKDSKRHNNRWCNLRPANHQQNMCNRTKQKNNTSGHVGVYWNKERSRYKAQIKFRGKNIHLGYFDIFEDATKSYKDAAVKYFGEFVSEEVQ